MKCEKCGFPIKPGDAIMVYGVLKHRDCFGAMIDLVEAAEGRIADLEAQLAALKAGEWWAVTEKPPTDVTIEMIVVGLYHGNNEFWDESFGAMVEPTHWRPAPPEATP